MQIQERSRQATNKQYSIDNKQHPITAQLHFSPRTWRMLLEGSKNEGGRTRLPNFENLKNRTILPQSYLSRTLVVPAPYQVRSYRNEERAFLEGVRKG